LTLIYRIHILQHLCREHSKPIDGLKHKCHHKTGTSRFCVNENENEARATPIFDPQDNRL
jgi:hypothetical protein